MKVGQLLVVSQLGLWGLAVSSVDSAANEQLPPPTLSCELRNLHQVEQGRYRATNLEELILRIALRPEKFKLEKLLDATGIEREKLTDDPTLEIVVTKLFGPRIGRPVKLSLEPGGGLHAVNRQIWIPVPIGQVRDSFVRYIDRLLEQDQPDDERTKQARQYLRENKKTMYPYLIANIYENEPGRYRIDCTYRASKDGFWNGEIEAEPVFVEIRFDKAFYDQDRFLPPAE